jgi:hypothetical protein
MLPALKIELCALDSLRLRERRLRKAEAAHIREVANSISAFGFNVPLLLGANNIVIDGEIRLEAARLLGISMAPCIHVDHLDEDEQRLLRLAINRLGEKGSWDIAELELEFKELIIAEAPLELSGFGSDEIDQIIIGSGDQNSEIGALAPVRGAKATAQIGDVFRLGPHRLVCGDATDEAVVASLMQGQIARLVLTDAELEFFNIKLESHDVIYAESAPVETLLEVGECAVNFSGYLRKYGISKTDAVRCAAFATYGGRRGELKSRVRSAISPWLDRREPIDVIRDRV